MADENSRGSEVKKFNSIELSRDELSQNLGGGIPKNSLAVFIGPDGAGKSVMAQRLTYGFLENKTSVCYISTELNTISFAEQMDSLSYDIKSNMLNNNLLFMPMFPVMGNTKLRRNFFEELLKTKQIFEKEIIIFDTLSFLLIRDDIENTECYDLINMLKRITTMGKTIIFFVDPTHLNETFLQLIKSICDIYINLSISKFAGNIVRVIEIVRFKRPEGAFQSRIPFRVDPQQGLAIEIASLD
jgi:archaeal flagellar protein FlaH